jgi:hypothetical protein
VGLLRVCVVWRAVVCLRADEKTKRKMGNHPRRICFFVRQRYLVSTGGPTKCCAGRMCGYHLKPNEILFLAHIFLGAPAVFYYHRRNN